MKVPSTVSPGAVHDVTIIDRRELAPGIVLIGFHAPELVGQSRPGAFVMVVPPSGEAASVALGMYEAEGNRASLLFFVVGNRTAELAALQPGAPLSMIGPLGNGFDLSSNPRDVGIVAGGVGIASVLLSAQALVRAGARVRLYYGARSRALLVERERFRDVGCEVLVATDDGSDGHPGYVTQLLEKSEDPPTLVLACGPSPMLRAVARVTAQRGIPAQLSLEETFACGVGGCWGCVVPITNASAQAPSFPDKQSGGSNVVHARVCVEGPVFWAHELRW